MLKFMSFGSGSSGNCYYLSTGTDTILIDAGVGIRLLKKRFQDRSLRLQDICAVLVTHDHADHVKCVGSLSKDYDLPVYTTAAVHMGIARNYCVNHKIAPAYTRIVEKGVPLQLGEFHVTPFGVPHDSCDNVGYQIENGGVTFCIMTDIGHVTEEMKTYINNANYLVIEANHDEEMLIGGNYPRHLKERIMSEQGHLSNKDCATALAEHASDKLRRVWLCHLSEENNHPELARKTIESILRSYGIIPGKDFEMEVLKRLMPSELYELT